MNFIFTCILWETWAAHFFLLKIVNFNVLVSDIQQSDIVLYTHTHTHTHIQCIPLFPFGNCKFVSRWAALFCSIKINLLLKYKAIVLFEIKISKLKVLNMVISVRKVFALVVLTSLNAVRKIRWSLVSFLQIGFTRMSVCSDTAERLTWKSLSLVG